ncbi:MAG: hypothetical protein L3J98_07915 [Gammaproteobacteria bacterium]|nr:hypothetical protein [Gammaproteobacteria bacterium]MCF6260074.1 hypothetical protein [Gammaproteobacteria bacterium]
MELKLVPKDEWENEAEPEGSEDGPLQYTGPDRRKASRRIKVDRREMIRFENTPDRRQNGDRRLNTRMWDGREF